MKIVALIALIFVALLLLVPAKATAQTPEPLPAVDVYCTSQVSYPQLEVRGDNLREQKRYDDALKCYQMAEKKSPQSAQLQNKMGIAQLMLNNYRAAEWYLRKAVKIDKHNSNALNNLGVVAYANRNYGKAADYYKKALAIDEGNASTHSNLGTAWFAQKKFDRAMAEYARALELNPDVFLDNERGGTVARVASPEERAKQLFMLAKLYAKRGDADRCLYCLRKAKDEGYRKMAEVYVDSDFAPIRQDPRLGQLVPPPGLE